MSVTTERLADAEVLPEPPRPELAPRPQGAAASVLRGSVRAAVAMLPLAGAMVLWSRSLSHIPLNSLGRAGLPPALPVTWYAAVALVTVAGAVSCWARRPNGLVIAAYVTAAVVILYATVPALADAPHYVWVYKHIGVTQFIQANGGPNPVGDIYSRWPGFFTLAASFANWVHLNPMSFAAWAEPFFALVDAILVAAVAYAVSADRRIAGYTALIFTVGNWIGQTYFSPQAVGLPLALAVVLVVLRAFQAPSMKAAATRLVVRLTRRSQPRQQLSVPLPWSPNTSAAIVLGLDLVIVTTHQLTPYVLLLQVGVLLLLGAISARWVLVGMAALTLGYLIPNLGYINHTFGLLTSVDPVQNATANNGPVKDLSFVNAHAGALLEVLLIALMVVAAWRLARVGFGRHALTLTALAVAPAGILFGQSYGGEASFRILLFSSPWRDVLIALAIGTLANRRLRQLSGAAMCALVVAVFIPAFYGAEELNIIPRAEVTASEYFSVNAPGGSVLISAAPDFPTAVGARYPLLHEYEPPFLNSGPDPTRTLGPSDVAAVIRQIRSYSSVGFIVFSTTESKYADLHNLVRPGALHRLERAIATSPRFRLWYRNADTRIYELLSGPDLSTVSRQYASIVTSAHTIVRSANSIIASVGAGRTTDAARDVERAQRLLRTARSSGNPFKARAVAAAARIPAATARQKAAVARERTASP